MKLQNEKQNEKKNYSNSQENYEEISEKKTSKLGYILLVIMAIFVIGVGETIFADLATIPERPTAPSRCISSTLNNLERLNYLSCPNATGFNEVDKIFGLDKEFGAIKPQLLEIKALNETLRSTNNEIRRLENSAQKLNKDYDLSLQEKMAQEEAIMDKQGIKRGITDNRNSIAGLTFRKETLENQIGAKILKLDPSVKLIEGKYQDAQEHYRNKKAWYRFKVFLLTLVFVLPFFAVSVYFYFKLKKKNSPYTIILTAAASAFSLLFLQVIGVFLYDILPKEWLSRIFRFFLEVPFLRYVIYYGSVILVIGIFGGIVFYIQKRVFSPLKVAIRRLKDKKCPGCSFPIDSQHTFCPDCGLQLKEECSNCGKSKIKYLEHCPNCGEK